MSGRKKLEQGDYRGAVRELTRSIRLDPKDAASHYLRALAWEALGRPDRARGDLDESLRLDPSNADARCGRGRTT